MVLLNFYVRIKVIKSYKRLSAQNPNIEPGLIFKKSKSDQYIREKYPESAEDIISFSKQLRTLIGIGISGFIIILAIFLYNYFN